MLSSDGCIFFCIRTITFSVLLYNTLTQNSYKILIYKSFVKMFNEPNKLF